jgi:hypothetical protein
VAGPAPALGIDQAHSTISPGYLPLCCRHAIRTGDSALGLAIGSESDGPDAAAAARALDNCPSLEFFCFAHGVVPVFCGKKGKSVTATHLLR